VNIYKVEAGQVTGTLYCSRDGSWQAIANWTNPHSGACMSDHARLVRGQGALSALDAHEAAIAETDALARAPRHFEMLLESLGFPYEGVTVIAVHDLAVTR
jgi:hypothetical protein